MKTVEELMKEINKEAGSDVITKGIVLKDYKMIPFTSLRLNYMTYGGLPRNCLTEFYGDEGSGKTSSSFDIVGNAQNLFEKEWKDEVEILQNLKSPSATQKNRLEYLLKRGKKKVFFLDIEGSFRPKWAAKFGVRMDVDSMYFLSAAKLSAEYILQSLLDFIETDTIGLFVLDSVAMLVKKIRIEKDLSQQTYCGNASVLAEFSALLLQLMGVHECTGLVINQTRDVIGSMFPQKKTPGGGTIKFTYVTRFMFSRGDTFDIDGKKVSAKAENKVCHRVNALLEKTKAFPPDRSVGYYLLNYRKGIDIYDDVIDIGIKLGYIISAGAWLSIVDKTTGEVTDDMKFQGRANLTSFLMNNIDVFNELSKKIQTDKEFLDDV